MLLNFAPHSRQRGVGSGLMPVQTLSFSLPRPWHLMHIMSGGGEGGEAAIRALKGSGREREGVASQVTSIPHSLASKNVSKQVAEEEAQGRHVHGVRRRKY